MKHFRSFIGPVALSTTISLSLLLAACGGSGVAGSESAGPGAGPGGGEGGSTGEGGRSGKGGDDDGNTSASISVGQSGSSSGGGVVCDSADDEDRDQDGYTRSAGDCNDCDANVNPDAIEVAITEVDPETGEVPQPADEDCDGTVDNVPAADCDAALELATTEGIEGARAMDLCKDAPAAGG